MRSITDYLDVQVTLFVGDPQSPLVHLSDTGLGNFIRKYPILGNPELRYPTSEVMAQFGSAQGVSLSHYQCQRTLLPAFVVGGDDRHLGDVGMCE
jgi:hypothetical protein